MANPDISLTNIYKPEVVPEPAPVENTGAPVIVEPVEVPINPELGEASPVVSGDTMRPTEMLKRVTDWFGSIRTSSTAGGPVKKVVGELTLTPEYMDKMMSVPLGGTKAPVAGASQAIRYWELDDKGLEALLEQSTALVKKTPQTDKAMIERANAVLKEHGMSTVTNLPQRGDLEPRLIAAGAVFEGSMEVLDKMAKEVRAGNNTPEMIAEIGRQLGRTMFIANKIESFKSELGGALRATRTDPSSLKDLGKDMQKALGMQGITPEMLIAGGPDVHDIALRAILPLNKRGTVTWLKTWAAYPDAVLEAWIAGLVSGPSTHAANTLGNGFGLFTLLVERQMAGFAGKLHGGNKVYMGEAGQSVLGMLDGFMDGLSAIKSTDFMRNTKWGDLQSAGGMWPARAAHEMGIPGVAGTMVDTVRNIFRAPLVGLGMEDAMFIGVASGGERRALAYRMAKQRGLSGQQRIDFQRSIMNEPEQFAAVHEAAREFGMYATFNKELGTFAGGLNRWVNDNPYLLKPLFTFVRTPTNLFKFGGERVLPVAALNTPYQYAAKGGVAGDLAAGKLAVAAGISALVYQRVATGVISGPGSFDPELRRMEQENGFKPYSYFDGDQYVELSRTDPLAMVLQLTAAASYIIQNSDTETGEQAAAMTVAALSTVVTDRLFLRSVTGFLEATSESKKAEHSKQVNTFFGNLAASAMPLSGAIHQTARVLDPQVKDAQGWMDRIIAGLPGKSKNVPPNRDLYGRPVVYEQFGAKYGYMGYGLDFVSPFRRMETTLNEPGINEIARLQMVVDKMPRTLAGPKDNVNPDQRTHVLTGVILTPTQYNDLQKELRVTKLGGMTLKDRLDSLVQGWDKYRADHKVEQLPEGAKRIELAKWISSYRLMATQGYLDKNPDIADARLQRMEDQILHRLGPDGEKPRKLPEGYPKR